jgi:hypothetical protein
MNKKPIVTSDGRKCWTGPECQLHFPTPANLDKSLNKKLDKVDKGTIPNPLAKLTPVNVDTILADLYYQRFAIRSDQAADVRSLERANQRIKNHPENGNPQWLETYNKDKETYTQRIQEKQKLINEILDEETAYEAEYERRGRWTRAFIVRNGNGHIHKTMNCSTCYPTTSFGWLTDYSGKNEAGVIEDAGEKACTVCYPDAPVEVRNRPSKIEDPELREKRIERENAKLARDAKKALTGITTPDGEPLHIESYYGVVKTARTAEIEAVARVVDLKVFDANLYGNRDPERRQRYADDHKKLIEALAHKFGKTEEEYTAIVEAKADKKFKKDYAHHLG